MTTIKVKDIVNKLVNKNLVINGCDVVISEYNEDENKVKISMLKKDFIIAKNSNREEIKFIYFDEDYIDNNLESLIAFLDDFFEAIEIYSRDFINNIDKLNDKLVDNEDKYFIENISKNKFEGDIKNV